MANIANPRLLYVKALLLVGAGLIASVLVILESPSLKIVLLLAIAVWAFARAYYFAFYVIEHYIDPEYRYAGLLSFVRHALARRRENGRR
jgi:hypothetical protein